MDRPNKNVARGEATRGQLIAMARRMFAEHGYENTSVEAVLREAGVSRGSLYHHFASKEALFEAVAEDVETSVGEQTLAAAGGSGGPVAALRAGFLAWIRLAGDPVVRRILLIDAPSVLGWERWRSMEERHALGLIRGVLQVIAEAGKLRPELSRHARARAARVGQRGRAACRPVGGPGGGDAGRDRRHRRDAAAPVYLTRQAPVASAAARPAWRPLNRQPPRKEPSSGRQQGSCRRGSFPVATGQSAGRLDEFRCDVWSIFHASHLLLLARRGSRTPA